MNQLIQITSAAVGDTETQTVNARELHAFLEVGKVFAAWIQERIVQYDFVENQDFVVFSDSGNNLKGGRPAKEYHLTLDMAKELAMVERNEKGKQARQYFIECERQAKQLTVDPMKVLADPVQLRALLSGYSEKVVQLENKVLEQAPKVEAFNRIANTDGSFCIRDAAKTLQIPEKKLMQFLIENNWVYRRPMGTGYLAYSDRIKSGFLEHKITTGEKSDGTSWTNTQARITAKGLAKLADCLGNAVSA